MIVKNRDPLKLAQMKRRFNAKKDEFPGNSRPGVVMVWSSTEAGAGR